VKTDVTGGIAPYVINPAVEQLLSQATLAPPGTPRWPLARSLVYLRRPSRRSEKILAPGGNRYRTAQSLARRYNY
jgi:hypothetical protein